MRKYALITAILLMAILILDNFLTIAQSVTGRHVYWSSLESYVHGTLIIYFGLVSSCIVFAVSRETFILIIMAIVMIVNIIAIALIDDGCSVSCMLIRH